MTETTSNLLESLDLVVCGGGDQRFGFEAGWVLSAHPVSDTTARDLEACLGLRRNEQNPRQTLKIADPGGAWHLNVAQPLEHGALAVSHIHPLPPLLHIRPPLPGLRALALWNNTLIFLLDPRKLAG